MITAWLHKIICLEFCMYVMIFVAMVASGSWMRKIEHGLDLRSTRLSFWGFGCAIGPTPFGPFLGLGDKWQIFPTEINWRFEQITDKCCRYCCGCWYLGGGFVLLFCSIVILLLIAVAFEVVVVIDRYRFMKAISDRARRATFVLAESADLRCKRTLPKRATPIWTKLFNNYCCAFVVFVQTCYLSHILLSSAVSDLPLPTPFLFMRVPGDFSEVHSVTDSPTLRVLPQVSRSSQPSQRTSQACPYSCCPFKLLRFLLIFHYVSAGFVHLGKKRWFEQTPVASTHTHTHTHLRSSARMDILSLWPAQQAAVQCDIHATFVFWLLSFMGCARLRVWGPFGHGNS